MLTENDDGIRVIPVSDVLAVRPIEGGDHDVGIVVSVSGEKFGIALKKKVSAKLLVGLSDALRLDGKGPLERRSLHTDPETGVDASFAVQDYEIVPPELKSGQFVMEVDVGDGLNIPLSMSPEDFDRFVAACAVALHSFRETREPLRN